MVSASKDLRIMSHFVIYLVFDWSIGSTNFSSFYSPLDNDSSKRTRFMKTFILWRHKLDIEEIRTVPEIHGPNHLTDYREISPFFNFGQQRLTAVHGRIWFCQLVFTLVNLWLKWTKKVLMKRMTRKLKNWNGIDFMDLDFINYFYFKQNYYMADF